MQHHLFGLCNNNKKTPFNASLFNFYTVHQSRVLPSFVGKNHSLHKGDTKEHKQVMLHQTKESTCEQSQETLSGEKLLADITPPPLLGLGLDTEERTAVSQGTWQGRLSIFTSTGVCVMLFETRSKF